MAKRRRRKRRRLRRRRPKFLLGDKVRINKVSVAYRLAELGISIGAGVHIVITVRGPSSFEAGLEKGGYFVGCLPRKAIPWAVGTRARSRVDCMECLALHPDKT